MSRIYVEDTNGLSCNRWNIYSTIVEDYLLDEWCSFGELVSFVIDEQTKNKIEEMSSLMTEHKKVNYMTREEVKNERLSNEDL